MSGKTTCPAYKGKRFMKPPQWSPPTSGGTTLLRHGQQMTITQP